MKLYGLTSGVAGVACAMVGYGTAVQHCLAGAGDLDPTFGDAGLASRR